MSEIAFLNELGDALERAAASASAPQRRWWRRGRVRLAVVVALLAIGGGASAAALLNGSTATDLAANSVACYDAAGGVTVLASDGRSPTALCASVPGAQLPASGLVACIGASGANGPLVAVYPAARPDECAHRGLAPLPAPYRSAQTRVHALGRALIAVERSRDCVPLAEFSSRAAAVLGRLGWSGWSVRVEDLRHEPCGGLSEGGAGVPSISSSLEAGTHTLKLVGIPPHSVLEGERATWRTLEEASGASCLTVGALESLAQTVASSHDLSGAFAVTREPRFTGVGDGRQPRYDSGCAVMAGVELLPGSRRLDVLIYSSSGASAAPQGSTPPASSFTPAG